MVTIFLVSVDYENFDLENICTPFDAERSNELLILSNYNKSETKFLVDGFTKGFDICYTGPKV